ncbi:threonine ammonia-lyase [Salinarimonas soli]|uniref:Pyridoxal-phosphate dependent enzyme n=1 Tax=Salinarimonas soli TaxID=1638099 RepID=A0A5B2W114_9HYPH|nr:pyridoxal-phosphate dependent enzyme [Salinarimonas soli]KAA2244342.1 pyridoxal-phosphate dependent enzyme [Salinarimonas soli]
MPPFDVTLADIEAARPRIAPHVRRTPAYASAALSALLGRPTIVKLETLQLAGCFKVRGVVNKILSLSEEEHRRGLVTVSGGNHAIAVARMARAFGLDALVLMPQATPAFNLDLTRAEGASVELCADAAEAFAKAEEHQARGRLYIHPYDDPLIIAGHGTLGLEVLEDAPDITHAVVSIGGGGFAAGVAAALKGRRPDITVIGVETTGAPTMTEALRAGHPVPIRPTSIARTLGAPFVTERTLAAARTLISEIRLVEDADVVRDLVWLLQHERVLTEPAAACVLTAARAMAADLPADARLALILCGSNVALGDIDAWRTGFGV